MKKTTPGASSNQVCRLLGWLEIPSASVCSGLAPAAACQDFQGFTDGPCLLLQLFRNTYIPHGWVKVEMLALVEGFLSSLYYPVPMA